MPDTKIKVNCNICNKVVITSTHNKSISHCPCQNVTITNYGVGKYIHSEYPALTSVFDYDLKRWFPLNKKSTLIS